jgi:probable F420-dependent oxidoreductase
MRFGVHVPQWGAAATRDGVLAVVRTIEQSGLDSAWVADHVVFPLQSRTVYPYRDGGVPFAPEDGFLEALVTLSALAGVTERIELGTSVLALPMRHPLVVAKQAATLDLLSGGRLILGLGAGWWEEEFRALGSTFGDRGRRFDEQIEIMRAAWTEGMFAWDGDFYSFDSVACLPRPAQPGGPRIWIGGNSRAARRRAGHFGDGWHALGSDGGAIAAGKAEVARVARAAGRDPSSISVSTSAGLPPDPEQAVKRMLELAACGVTHVVLNARAETAADLCRAIESFAANALSTIRRELSAAVG